MYTVYMQQLYFLPGQDIRVMGLQLDGIASNESYAELQDPIARSGTSSTLEKN